MIDKRNPTASRWLWHKLRRAIAARWVLLSAILSVLALGPPTWQTITRDPLSALRPRSLFIAVIPGLLWAASMFLATTVWTTRDPDTSRRRAWWQYSTFATATAVYLISGAVFDGLHLS